MALIKCSNCGHDVSDKAKACPHCGCPIQAQTSENIDEEVIEKENVNNETSNNDVMGVFVPDNSDNSDYETIDVEDDEPERGGAWKWLLVPLVLLLGACGYFAYTKYFAKSATEPAESTIELIAEEQGNNEEKKEDKIDETNAIVELTPEFIAAVQKYDKLSPFSEGLAAVCRNGKWGYINTRGEEVIPCKYVDYDGYSSYYESTESFHEGLAAIKKGDKWGYINARGEEVIPITFRASLAGSFNEGLAVILNENETRFTVIDKQGNTVFNRPWIAENYAMYISSAEMPIFIDGKVYIPTSNSFTNYIIYDKQGNKIGKASRETVIKKVAQNYSNKHYTSFTKTYNSGKDNEYYLTGLKDSNGKVVVPALYDGFSEIPFTDDIYAASNGVFLVTLEEHAGELCTGPGDGIYTEDMKTHYGYVDLKGKDTFSNKLKQRCRRALEIACSKAAQQESEDFEQERELYEQEREYNDPERAK